MAVLLFLFLFSSLWQGCSWPALALVLSSSFVVMMPLAPRSQDLDQEGRGSIDDWRGQCGTLVNYALPPVIDLPTSVAYEPWGGRSPMTARTIISCSTLGWIFGAGLRDHAVYVGGRVVGRIISKCGGCFDDGLGDFAHTRLGEDYAATDCAVTPMARWGREPYPSHEDWQARLLGGEQALPCLGDLLPAFRSWMRDPTAQMMQRKKGRVGVHMTRPAVDFVVLAYLLAFGGPLNLVVGWNASRPEAEFRRQLQFLNWALRLA